MKKLFFLLLFFLFFFGRVTYASYQIDNYINLRTQQMGIDTEKFKSLIECESNSTHFFPSGKMIAGDHGTSFGILQFKKDTLEKYAKFYGYKNDITNFFLQIDLALLMLQDNDNRFHWKNCSEKNKIVSYLKPRLRPLLTML